MRDACVDFRFVRWREFLTEGRDAEEACKIEIEIWDGMLRLMMSYTIGRVGQGGFMSLRRIYEYLSIAFFQFTVLSCFGEQSP